MLCLLLATSCSAASLGPGPMLKACCGACRARLDGYSQLRQAGQGAVKANPFAEPPAGLRKSGDLTSSSDGSASYRERLARLRRPE